MAVHLNPGQIGEMFKKYIESGDIQEYGRNLCYFGEVKDIKYKDKIYAGKIILKGNLEDSRLISELRGPNIIRFHKICESKIDNGIKYHLIIMEKAILMDMYRLIIYYGNHNLLSLVFKFPFDETMNDCLLRFFVKQIVDALEILNRVNCNYLFRPENILITANLILKLSNFKNVNKIKDYTKDMMIKCFTLGRTIFYIKFGKKIFEDNELEKSETKEQYIDILLKKISEENKYNITDRDLIYLLIKLIKSEITFEQIYRNKWLNKNVDYIEKVLSNFEIDEEKLLNQLLKQDFIIKKNKIIEYNTKVINKNLLYNYKYNKRKKGNRDNFSLFGKKFKFKKKMKNIEKK